MGGYSSCSASSSPRKWSHFSTNTSRACGKGKEVKLDTVKKPHHAHEDPRR